MNKFLNTKLNKFKILYPNNRFYFFDEIDSTNNFCKKLAIQDFHNPTVVFSDTQTCGRGRNGKTWTSPKNSGLWFSILLKPHFTTKLLGIIPILVSTAIYESLYEFGIKVSIKWPNDIFINEKKVCGILTESNLSDNNIDYLIIGIGINVNLSLEDFDDELKDTATSLKISYNKDFDRFDILDTILKNFNNLYYNLTENNINEIIEKYKANSCVLNKKVSLHYNNTYEIVTPINIMNDGSLLVKDQYNKLKQIYSGEVSLRF